MQAVGGESFDASAAVGGWRGVLESAAPTVVFVTILALRPEALVLALGASLVVSTAFLVARVVAGQPLTQVLGGAVLALISAAWAWRTGRASNFYATGLLINAVMLAVTAGSLALRRPLVGIFIELWRTASTADTGKEEAEGSPQGERAAPGEHASWRTDPALASVRRRYAVATTVLSGMFALRLVVEVPLYLMGEPALGALGVARIVLGVPLYALTLWFVWRIARPGTDQGRGRGRTEPAH
ncbi:DUF3159 domain-containing protein [Actinomyces sp.]|uniref:DUF3159 domain-containing protein n=1 Tax=Actinomyces sp. TaxID=29317 RepID=UPI0034C6782C